VVIGCSVTSRGIGVISGEHHLQTTGGGLLLHFLCVRSQPILLMPEGFSVIVGTPFERIR
jgi:hypothetical protein